jgi:hypothetical protein
MACPTAAAAEFGVSGIASPQPRIVATETRKVSGVFRFEAKLGRPAPGRACSPQPRMNATCLFGFAARPSRASGSGVRHKFNQRPDRLGRFDPNGGVIHAFGQLAAIRGIRTGCIGEDLSAPGAQFEKALLIVRDCCRVGTTVRPLRQPVPQTASMRSILLAAQAHGNVREGPFQAVTRVRIP